jgi:hypothetical protein
MNRYRLLGVGLLTAIAIAFTATISTPATAEPTSTANSACPKRSNGDC